MAKMACADKTVLIKCCFEADSSRRNSRSFARSRVGLFNRLDPYGEARLVITAFSRAFSADQAIGSHAPQADGPCIR